MIAATTKRIITRYLFSSYKNSLINAPPHEIYKERPILKENLWLQPDTTFRRSQQTHLSNGEYLIRKVPVIHSSEAVVRCIGGTEIGTGHPQVYIQLNTKRQGAPVSCKWCGLRFALRPQHH